MTLVDTHCHLDMPAFDGDRDEVVARARAAGVTRILVPGVRPASWDGVAALAERHPEVRIAVGIHPQAVFDLSPAEQGADVAAAAERLGAVAVGECGLDGASPARDAQERVFRAHVAVARALRLPLVIHVLRAHDAALRILREERVGEAGGVLHSYSGSVELVAQYAALGLAFSFAGPVTYANARRPVAAAAAIPDDLLLAETDAPDQAPEPHRGQRCEPAHVGCVVAALARIRGAQPADIAALTRTNACRVLGL